VALPTAPKSPDRARPDLRVDCPSGTATCAKPSKNGHITHNKHSYVHSGDTGMHPTRSAIVRLDSVAFLISPCSAGSAPPANRSEAGLENKNVDRELLLILGWHALQGSSWMPNMPPGKRGRKSEEIPSKIEQRKRFGPKRK
jgi:hypothetical protein